LYFYPLWTLCLLWLKRFEKGYFDFILFLRIASRYFLACSF
jgi:hypothetical protein